MVKYEIEIDRPTCIACKTCINVCPLFWEMADDGYSHLKGSTQIGNNEKIEMDEIKCNLEAAELCPVNCIHVLENSKRII